MKLYGYWRSSCSWRVRIALALKGLCYDDVPVHLVRDGGEQHTDAHRARNPMGQVPVLELDDGTLLHQSLAIVQYLEAAHPEPPLLPAEPLRRARAWQLAEMVNAGIQPLQNLAVLLQVERHGLDRAAWGREHIARGLDAMEHVAADTAGRFLVGDDVTVADLCLVPQLYNARRFGLDVDRWATLARVEAAAAELDAFRAAHPDQQPDAPQE